MGIIHQGVCSACHTKSRCTSGAYRALLLDEPCRPEFAHPDDPNLFVLPSLAISYSMMEDQGYTLESAMRCGRLVLIQVVFCRSCGRMFEIRKLEASTTIFGSIGCLSLLAIIPVAAITGWWFIGGGRGFFSGYILGFLIWVAIESSIGPVVRWWYPERAARVATPAGCPHCGGRRYATVRSWTKVPCVACGKRAVRFEVWGMS